MADFPYVLVAAGLKKFFGHIPSAGVPEKVTQKYLEKVGFKSTNDRYIIGVLKFLGFIDASGVPTKLWQAYRSRGQSRVTIADAIRRSYADLFKTFPDAHRKDNEALRNYFSANTKVAERTLSAIVMTFKGLCDLGDFETALTPDKTGTDAVEKTKATTISSGRISAKGDAQVPTININIQLQLPATDDAGVYDKLFAALKKHLLSN